MGVQRFFKTIPSPVGMLRLVVSEKGVSHVLFQREGRDSPVNESEAGDSSHSLLLETEKQLNEYFARRRRSFSLPLDFDGNEFNRKVWNILLTIPYGQTCSYGDVAMRVGGIHLSRAVGGAVHNNPIVIINPCHRVIGSTGKLVGFGGGLRTKSYLLRLEDQFRNPVLFRDEN